MRALFSSACCERCPVAGAFRFAFRVLSLSSLGTHRGGTDFWVCFLHMKPLSDTLFGDFRSNQAGHRRSQGAHRRETHAVGTSRVGLSNAPGASVLPCVWTAPGAVAAVKPACRFQMRLGMGRRHRVSLMKPISRGETIDISEFLLRLRFRACSPFPSWFNARRHFPQGEIRTC